MKLIRDQIFDYAIIGGCPTGLTLAWLLVNAGKTVVVLEALNIGIETTGTYHTSVEPIRSPLSLSNSPNSQIRTFSRQEVNDQSKDLISKIITGSAIICDLKKFRNKKKLQLEYLQQSSHGIIEYPEAETIINALKYIDGIVKACSQAGATLMGGRRVLKVSKEVGRQVIYTSKGMVQCRELVYTPRSSRILMLYPKSFIPLKRYSVLAQLDQETYGDCEVGRLNNGTNYVITQDGTNAFLELTGADHRIIKGISNEKQFGILQKYILNHFGTDHFLLRWSLSYYKAAEESICVGQLSENVYLASGYCFSNLTISTFAAIVLSRKLIGEEKISNILGKKKVPPEVIIAMGKNRGKIPEEQPGEDRNKSKKPAT